jgi:hypothetical protein
LGVGAVTCWFIVQHCYHSKLCLSAYYFFCASFASSFKSFGFSEGFARLLNVLLNVSPFLNSDSN